jgi:hypothetical protein
VVGTLVGDIDGLTVGCFVGAIVTGALGGLKVSPLHGSQLTR